MRETEVQRFVAARPPEIERALTPRSIVAYEGSFEVLDVEEGDPTRVTAGARGLRMTLRFEDREDGLYYEQEGTGPFEEMWTTVRWEPENEGVRVTARSGLELGVPPAALTDRIGAWKRRGELRRALARLAEDVE